MSRLSFLQTPNCLFGLNRGMGVRPRWSLTIQRRPGSAGSLPGATWRNLAKSQDAPLARPDLSFQVQVSFHLYHPCLILAIRNLIEAPSQAVCLDTVLTHSTTPPFDRHDWIVTRPANPSAPIPSPASEKSDQNSGQTITTRYVIDYYSAPPDEDGNPVFSLDVRPALDSFESVSQRIKVSVEEWLGTQPPQ